MAPIPSTLDGPPPFLVVDRAFDDVDSMAVSAREWDQDYEQIGRGPFRGHLKQLVLPGMQLGRQSWSPGVLQRGPAPKNTWAFGLPLISEGSLHVRRRPVQRGELLAATCHDDIAFTATGRTTLVIVALPIELISRWLQSRRGVDSLRYGLASHWVMSLEQVNLRARALSNLVDELSSSADIPSSGVDYVQSRISDVILDMIPSAEVVESSRSRSRVARVVIDTLREHRDNPPSVAELCELVGAKERTLFLSCVEAFGKPPMQLLLELRLNAVHRALSHPRPNTTVTSAAASFGFLHFSRFAAMYRNRFGELPSATLTKALGT
jgi:AraC family transcriptional regulator, ethanolamine operon transcriptional activator